MKLEDKTNLITGASSGLGEALALALSEHGNRLVVTARRADRLQDLAEQVEAKGSQCVVSPADATNRDAVQEVIDASIQKFGPVDLAILNAGGGKAMHMGEIGIDEVLGIMRTNYDTLVHFMCSGLQTKSTTTSL